ncbi:MAG TPA: hypothetical protein PK776_03165 [Flavobacterium sp.]|nr:hypothetical protein [Flavobacterium sp.]
MRNKLKYWVGLSVFLLLIFTSCVNRQPVTKEIKLEQDEVAIIGYGSLASTKSMEKSLGREYTGVFEVTRLKGWKRLWNVFMPNEKEYKKFYYLEKDSMVFPKRIIYLNIEKDPKSFLNCCLFVIKKEDLLKFDQREWIYSREDVSNDLENIKIVGGTAYAYVALDQFIVKKSMSKNNAAIRKTYLDFLDAAFQDRGEDYKKEFYQTTIPFADSIVVQDLKVE